LTIGGSCVPHLLCLGLFKMLHFFALICTAGAATPIAHFYTGYGGGEHMVPQPIASPPAGPAQELPCPAEGFFPHPTEKSRFYRCVDHAGTGQVFSVYEFHCPQGQSFVKTEVDGMCVPTHTLPSNVQPQEGSSGGEGSYPSPVTTKKPVVAEIPQTGGGSYPSPGSGAAAADGTSMPVVEIDAQPATTTTTTTTTAPPPVTTTTSAPVTSGQVGGGAYPTPDNSAGGPSYPSPTTPAPSPSSGYPSPSGCAAKYLQDDKYCNVYRACPSDGKAYRCKTGSVFDQTNQMCRWIYRAADVCEGKPLMSEALFRSFPISVEGNLASHDPMSGDAIVSSLLQAPVGIYSIPSVSGADQVFIDGAVPSANPDGSNLLYMPPGAESSGAFLPQFLTKSQDPVIIYY